MSPFAKPTVFASKCLGFEACRWNGVTINDETVNRLKPHVNFITCCPEKDLGLGVPRKPVRLIRTDDRTDLFQPDTGKTLTTEMNRYTKQTLDSLPEVDGFILKHRSPSCGAHDVKLYAGKQGKSSVGRTSGLFAAQIIERWGAMAVEDEGRLKNFKIRERFLVKLFALADFRRVRNKGRVSGLIDFQARNKLLLMACNQQEQTRLGRIVANPQKADFPNLAAQYEQRLILALRTGPKIGTSINVLMHAFGYFKRDLKPNEKALFLDLLQSYRDRKVPLSALSSVILAWIERFDQDYLRRQTFFNPFPKDLLDIQDSGAGRDY